MYLVERMWAVVTSIISIVSLSPLHDGIEPQIPLSISLPSSLPVNTHVDGYPSFPAPGTPNNEPFQCEYPAMKGWENCSSSMDRKCWLRRKSDGKQFDINTDYENEMPIGIDRHYTLNVTDSWWAADGKNFTAAKLFNNTYPGPWIQACWGDRVIVNVTNLMHHNGTSVHWHGIRQLDSVHMDGVNGITQCPIAPKDYFVYNFTLKQYGSSWYHSHYSVQYADGAAGPMTIHGPSSADWDEAISPPLIMTDWYHNSAFEVLTNGNTGGKDILLNGRGNITKFNNAAKKETDIRRALNITFDAPRPGQGCKKYLLRVINTSFDTTFVFSIDNHLLQVASADFVPIQPYRNTSILVGIGQRYNVIVEANPLDSESKLDPYGNYWIRTQVAKCFGAEEGSLGYDEAGILRYDASSERNPTTKRWSKISRECSDETYTSLSPILPWTVKSPNNGLGQKFDAYAPKPKPEDYPIARFTLDDTGEALPMRINYSNPMFLHLNPEDQQPWAKLWRVVPENYTNNDWIYLVIDGHTKGKSGAHPMHLHGHDFAILEQAENKAWDPSKLNLKLRNPPRRDVVLLPTSGYVVIAFKADNPGPWLMHCHIAKHISMGLGMQIMEDQDGAFRIWPDNHSAVKEARRVCKNWDDWYRNETNWAFRPKPAGDCKYSNKTWCFQDDSGV